MLVPLGLGLIFVGGFALLMMNVTGHAPRRLAWKRRGSRKEDDPEAWRHSLILYGAMAGAGALLLILHFVAGVWQAGR